MSGRDWKRLVERHRAAAKNPGIYSNTQKGEELVNAYVTGSRRKKGYLEVDYNAVLKDIQASKAEGSFSSAKMDQLVSKTKKKREEEQMSEHRRAWSNMYWTLTKQLWECHKQVELWRATAALNSLVNIGDILSELLEFEAELKSDRDCFMQEVMGRVRLLRREVSGLIKPDLQGQALQSLQNKIYQEIQNTKKEHLEIARSLQEAWHILSDEVQLFINQTSTASNSQQTFSGGVPMEVWLQKCPSKSLRHAMANEFEKLDLHFQGQLATLSEQFETSSKSLLINWSEEDKLHYEMVLEQYPPGMNRRRTLYIDRLMREMPTRSRREIVDYETWSSAVQYYRTQKALLMDTWRQAHEELCCRVANVFREACQEWEFRHAFERGKEEQKKLCQELSAKVTKWRQQCQEKQQEEAERVTRSEREQRTLLEREESRLRKKREKIKDKIMEYNMEKMQKFEKAMEIQQHLEEEARLCAEKELKKGKERVCYREQLFKVRQEEIAAVTEELKQKEKEKERCLEALRQLVRIEAPIDPLRLLKDTEASKARVLPQEDGEVLTLRHPLFKINSFTDGEILSDRRFKVSTALREAGLLSTHYAQKLLSNIPPPRPLRPDQKSSLFK